MSADPMCKSLISNKEPSIIWDVEIGLLYIRRLMTIICYQKSTVDAYRSFIWISRYSAFYFMQLTMKLKTSTHNTLLLSCHSIYHLSTNSYVFWYYACCGKTYYNLYQLGLWPNMVITLSLSTWVCWSYEFDFMPIIFFTKDRIIANL